MLNVVLKTWPRDTFAGFDYVRYSRKGEIPEMNKKVVFVIGAGASKEANLPTGYELKEIISRLLNIHFDYRQKSGDHLIANALRKHVEDVSTQQNDINAYLSEARHIGDALPLAISIDNFIDNHKGNEKISLCGKLAIVRSILDAEKKSLLYFKKDRIDSNIDFPSIEETWYTAFFKILTENCGIDDLEDRFRSVTLIIFNYDRCVEHFLKNSLQKFYQISKDEASDLVGFIDIFHPYGSVGMLPWFNSGGSMDFGTEPNAEELLKLTHQIKTFTEETDPDSGEISIIRDHVKNARKLVFLGFAFHKINMQLISPSGHADDYSFPKCYATASGVSSSDQEVISKQINELYGHDIDTRMANLKCADFFKEFWRSLAF